jgi:hypothetical protein
MSSPQTTDDIPAPASGALPDALPRVAPSAPRAGSGQQPTEAFPNLGIITNVGSSVDPPRRWPNIGHEPVGCICPPGANLQCENLTCPRKPSATAVGVQK